MDPFSVFTWEKTKQAIQDLQDLLQCLICRQQPEKPLSMGTCDHFFCASCISQLPTNSCPVCDIPSIPVQHQPDAIVTGLVTSAADILTLINGGKISRKVQNLEAPADLDFKKHGITTKRNGPQPKKDNKKQKKTNVVEPKQHVENGASIIEKSTISPSSSCSNLNRPLQKKLGKSKSSPKSSEPRSVPSKSIAMTSPGVSIHSKRNNKGETVFHSACLKGDLDKIEKLLNEGADPNTKDNAGWTPLHEACSNGHFKAAELLLKFGALVDAPGSNNTTPLHDAVVNGLPEVVAFLRKWGASHQQRDIWGRTPRSLAALTSEPERFYSALDTCADSSLPSSQRKSTLSHSKLVLTGSNLDSKCKRDLDLFAKQIKARVVSDFTPEVTHVVTNCIHGTSYCERSLKYMMGVVSGKLIVSSSWITECISSGTFVNPESFEVTGSSGNPSSGAPAKARENFAHLKPGLFSGLHIYFQGNFSDNLPSKKDLELLVKYGNGIPLQREPNPESISDLEQTVPFYAALNSPLEKCSHLLIYQEGPNEPILKYDMPHIKSLPMAWFLECIDNCMLVEPFK